MADDGKITGNEVVSSDFVKVLLALKENTMKDTHCLELAIVKEIDSDKVICQLISNPSLTIQAIRINLMKLNIGQVVLVGFNDNDFKSNLNKYSNNDTTLQKSSTETRHTLTNGVVVTNFTEGGSDFSGSYNDLTNKPILDTTEENTLNPSPNENIQGTLKLHKISKTGSYLDLLNKPIIPEADSDLTNNRYVRFDTNAQNLTVTEQENARTNINAYSKPSNGIPGTDLAEDYIAQGDTLTAPLTITGGDGVNAGKLRLDQATSGQITDNTTSTLFGFLSNNTTTLTVGSNSYTLNLRGLGTRPQYKGDALALYSDIVADTNTWRAIKVNGVEKLNNDPTGNPLDLIGGNNVTLTENNGAITIDSPDTGAIQASNQFEFNYLIVNDYVNWTTTDEYVGFTVFYNSTPYKVTSSNKDNLGITAGTTVAYSSPKGVFSGGYNSSTRTMNFNQYGTVLTINDTNNVLDVNSIYPVQNKVLARLIPSQASSSNQLADKDFVNSSINALAAYYITRNAAGDNFRTNAELMAATTFYSGGAVRIPTTNDYTYVQYDETKATITSGYSSFTTTAQYINHFVIYNNEGIEVTLANKDSLGIVPGTTIAYDDIPTTRYSYQGGNYPNGQWEFQLIVNNSSLTAAQIAAINSGITAALVAQITTNQTSMVTNVSYDSVNKKLQQTINNNTTDVITFGDNAFNSTHIPGYKGMYDANTQYYVGDIVEYSSTVNPMMYICIQNTLGNSPTGPAIWNNSYWRALSYDAARCYIQLGTDSQKKYLWGNATRGSNYGIANTSSDKIYMQDDYLFSNDKKVIDESDLYPAFSDSSTYSVGDIVIYNHLYYQCTTAVTTPGAWDSNNWAQKTFNQLVPTVNDATITVTQGGVTKGTFTLNQNSNYTLALDAGGSGSSGTQVSVGGTDVSTLAFTTDPQTQLDNLSNNKANDSAVVHKTGSETISGTKTFTSSSGIRIGSGGPYLRYNSTYNCLSVVF